ncbi:hypothetical protein MMC20_000624 [Loxospora ochrophaea]|nr:hypothetical protein [Loxospora ochrophaea]
MLCGRLLSYVIFSIGALFLAKKSSDKQSLSTLPLLSSPIVLETSLALRPSSDLSLYFPPGNVIPPRHYFTKKKPTDSNSVWNRILKLIEQFLPDLDELYALNCSARELYVFYWMCKTSLAQKHIEHDETCQQIVEALEKAERSENELRQIRSDMNQVLEKASSSENELRQTRDKTNQALEKASSSEDELRQTRNEMNQVLEKASSSENELRQTRGKMNQPLEKASRSENELRQTRDKMNQALEKASSSADELQQTRDKMNQALEKASSSEDKLRRARDDIDQALEKARDSEDRYQRERADHSRLKEAWYLQAGEMAELRGVITVSLPQMKFPTYADESGQSFHLPVPSPVRVQARRAPPPSTSRPVPAVVVSSSSRPPPPPSSVPTAKENMSSSFHPSPPSFFSPVTPEENMVPLPPSPPSSSILSTTEENMSSSSLSPLPPDATAAPKKKKVRGLKPSQKRAKG